jgi:hypothetical protein
VPPTRPLLIWAWMAIACAVLLAVEGTMLLSGRQRQWHGWRLGVLLLMGNFFAVGLAARLYDIHTELLRTRCNCEPFQGTEPQIAVPVTLATVLGSFLLVFTALCSVGTLTVFRSPGAAVVAPGRRMRAWSFSGRLVGCALLADGGAWILTNGIVRLTETAYLIDPMVQGDALGILPLYEAIANSLCGAFLLIGPLAFLLLGLRRSRRASLGSAT